MEPKIKHILYASDLSVESEPALAWAMMLADRHEAPITFLHVMEELSPHTAQAVRSFMGEDKWQEMTLQHQTGVGAGIQDRIKRFCDSVHSDLSACAMMVKEVAIKSGNPVEVILEQAEVLNSDIIVMGTQGGGLFKDAMIGSTARRVVRRSKIPVFVIPLPDRGD
jgi:nucleotide-binding universal stress UspA family protein